MIIVPEMIGSVVGGLGFVTPGFVLMLVASWLYVDYGTDTVAVKFTKGGDGGNVPQFDTPLPDEQATTTESVFAVPKHGSPNVDVFGKI